MLLPIYAFGCSILRQKSEDIKDDYKDLDLLIENMYETSNNAFGVGLAAPQIGLNIRIFVIDTTLIDEKHPEYNNIKNFKSVFINPKIISLSGEKVFYEEGCLSIPDIFYNVERPKEVEIEYYDEKFNLHKKKFTGFISRIIQHEYDHLEGILFIDKMSSFKRKTIQSKLTKIINGNIATDYKMKFNK